MFTSHADAAFDICFENVLEGRTSSSSWFQGIGLRAAEVARERRSSQDSSDAAHPPRATDKYVENPVRSVELDVDIGADAKDWSAIQATEKLKPVETELRRIEEMVAEIVNEMDYLRIREQKLRDTNESTNTRVKWFGMLTTFLLIGLWGWQIMYLRAYFRLVKLLFSVVWHGWPGDANLCCVFQTNQVQASDLGRRTKLGAVASGTGSIEWGVAFPNVRSWQHAHDSHGFSGA